MHKQHTPRHRAFRTAKTKAMRPGFQPKHCAGETCLHDHHQDDRPPMTYFKPVTQPTRSVA